MDQTKPEKLQSPHDDKGIAASMREIILGSADGLVSTLGLVTGVAAGTPHTSVVLLAGVAGAVSGAISMSAGNYLGVKSQIEVLERQLAEEEKSIRENPEHEREELVSYYKNRGMTEEELKVIIPAIERNKDLLMEEMAAHELGISQTDVSNPTWKAVWIFFAFVFAAMFPILPYAFFDRSTGMVISIAGTLIALFGVGAAKTIFTHRNPIKSGLEMLVIALAAGVAGYLAGRLIAGSVEI